MGLVEIDPIRLETTQRGLHGASDVRGGKAALAGADLHANLGRDDHLVAAYHSA